MALASVLGMKAGHMLSAMFLKENHDNMKALKIIVKMLMDNIVSTLEKKMVKFSSFSVVFPLSCLQR